MGEADGSQLCSLIGLHIRKYFAFVTLKKKGTGWGALIFKENNGRDCC